ncbi:FAD-dependent monooxygenase [Catenulispora yoronensis]|uniref:FAD-dependent monooxygenase n=1 Tax=Catenulispora yoronensis TaxID=450799 RepID=UPI0031E08C9B
MSEPRSPTASAASTPAVAASATSAALASPIATIARANRGIWLTSGGTTVWTSSLAGKEFGRLRTWYTHPAWQAEHDLASATAICDLPQDRLEPILVTAAGLRGATQLLNTEFRTFAQDAEGVTAQVADRVTVLTGPSGAQDWKAAAAKAEAELGFEVAVHSIGFGGDYQDTYGTFGRGVGIAGDGALLVRPDHMVGWHAEDSG